MQVSSGSFSIFSKRPPGALGVDTITMKGSDFAKYLSDTCLTFSCFDILKNLLHPTKSILGYLMHDKPPSDLKDTPQ